MMKHTTLDAHGQPIRVGDIVRQCHFGPKALPRTVEQIGCDDHTAGHVVVTGLLGWHLAKRFEKERPVPPGSIIGE
jgi:hypothetical protein